MPKLLYFVSEDWFFLSHFFDRAVAARDAGFEVAVVTRVVEHGESIRRAGFELVSLDMDRSGVSVAGEVRTLRALCAIYRRVRPDLVHHVALKPILYGTIAAWAAGIRNVVNAPVGMGYVFTSRSLRARLLRPVVSLALRLLLNPPGSQVIVENRDDLQAFLRNGMVVADAVSLIRGAGVSLSEFQPCAEPAGPPIVILIARMLMDKGIVEFVEAARLLRAAGLQARFLLVGAPDTANPASIEKWRLEAWQSEGTVEWLGRREDIAALLAGAHVVCLPSYREGLPKTLAEAAAAGRPIVTTDVPGCREVVRDGIEGLLVPPRESARLACALERLLRDPELRLRMGSAARARAVECFSTTRINEETLSVYRKLLGTLT